MTGRRAHIATQWQVAGGGSILRCMCGQWESDRTQTLRVQRAAHRAHRVEMGERVARVRPSLSERVAAVRALAEDWVNTPPLDEIDWEFCDPTDARRSAGRQILAALDGEAS